MEFIITVKNPDSIEESIRKAAEDLVEVEVDGGTLTDNECNALVEEKMEELWEACNPWVEYKEYIRIKIDTTRGTAKVCEV